VVVLVISTQVGPSQPKSLAEARCPRLHSRNPEEGQNVPDTLIRVSPGPARLAVRSRIAWARFDLERYRYRGTAVT